MNKYHDIFERTKCVSEEMLTKYIDGTLSPAERHEIEKHLIDCEMCSDAVEGSSMVSGNKISSVTAELNRKIQDRVEKKEVKVIFLQQYRTQLAIAASIILVVGLVWFFKSNVSMKEMDNAAAEKMFADKFEPPPADLDNEATEQFEPDANSPVTANGPVPSNIAVDGEGKKAVPEEESPAFITVEGAKSGKDIADEKHLGLAEKQSRKLEDVPAQKGEKLQQEVIVLKSEEKEDQNYWRYKNAETTPKGNVITKSEITAGDEDIVLLEKESSKNQLESLKEKDKKADGTKKPQSAATVPNVDAVTATGTTSVSSNQPVQDKSAQFAKQDNKKTADDREGTDENNIVNRAQSGEGDVLAFEAGKKSKDPKSGDKGKESKAPKKKSVQGYYDVKTTTSAPMPETQSQTKTIVTESRNEVSGKLADSVVMLEGTFESTIAVDGLLTIDSAMIKYDKQDYGGAVKEFEQALKQNPNDEKALFYSAVSYMSLGQTDKALVNLNKILANKNSKYYEDAQWYSSLAYIKNNDLKNARMNLIPLQNNEKSKYKKQADETLEQIKK